MPEITISNFSKGIISSPGFIQNARETAASDIRNLVVNDEGRLVRRDGRTRKNTSALTESPIRVMPCYYNGSNSKAGTTNRTHLIVQTTTKLWYWNGSSFIALAVPTTTLTSGAVMDWVVAGGRLFMANGNEPIWVDLSAAIPVAHHWGITPNADSTYAPTIFDRQPVAGTLNGGFLTADKFYAYAFTFYNDTYDIESKASRRSISIQPTGALLTGQLILWQTFNTDPQATHIRIYRTAAQDTTDAAQTANLQLLAQTANGDLGSTPGSASITGTHDGANNATRLTDTTKNFKNLGVTPGNLLTNTTNSGTATVTGLSTDTNSFDTVHYYAHDGVSAGFGKLSNADDFDTSDGYSISFIQFNDLGEITGAHTGADNSSDLVDGAKDFRASSTNILVAAFDTITNATDSSTSKITDVTTTTDDGDTLQLDGLAGGSDNDFDTQDDYHFTFTQLSTTPPTDDNPPSDLEHIVHHAGRIWGSRKNSSVIHFSSIDGDTGLSKYDAFPGTSAATPHIFYVNREDGDIITGFEPVPNAQAVHIFKENSVTLMRGTGLITGLYQPVSGLSGVDLDVSLTNRSAGCIAPRSIATVGGQAVVFFAVDRQIWAVSSGGQMEPISLPIQPLLDDIPTARLTQPVGANYKNHYLLAFPSGNVANDLIASYDFHRRFWTIHEISSTDLIWATGQGEDVLYSANSGVSFIDQLFDTSTTTDVNSAGNAVPFLVSWESNQIQLPRESVVTGFSVYLDNPATVNAKVVMDGLQPGFMKNFIPSRGNSYRCGMFKRGSFVKVKVSSTMASEIERMVIHFETQG